MSCTAGENTVLSYSENGSIYTAVANSLTISGPKMSISAVDCTVLADNHKFFRPSTISDPGTLDVEGFFDPTETSAVALFNYADVPETVYWQITFADTSTATFTGFITKFELNGMSLDSNLGFSASIQISGQIVLDVNP